jgi:hypothetical protein
MPEEGAWGTSHVHVRDSMLVDYWKTKKATKWKCPLRVAAFVLVELVAGPPTRDDTVVHKGWVYIPPPPTSASSACPR